MKEIWKRRERPERKGGEIGIKMCFLGIGILCLKKNVIRNSKAVGQNKAYNIIIIYV
jgi:hypothetical protein